MHFGIVIITAINHCLANPCNGNGNCTSLNHTFVCNCYDGFSGNTCEIRMYDCTDLNTESKLLVKSIIVILCQCEDSNHYV